ncbi:hypothetical protein RND81_04G094500 [Saponaria officinalis]|uniref:Uncharacterized protein n=1 Tax=Saponaria officinalis TaxID=3572 RepID=A0AAW1LJK6_SAPOF
MHKHNLTHHSLLRLLRVLRRTYEIRGALCAASPCSTLSFISGFIHNHHSLVFSSIDDNKDKEDEPDLNICFHFSCYSFWLLSDSSFSREPVTAPSTILHAALSHTSWIHSFISFIDHHQ